MTADRFHKEMEKGDCCLWKLLIKHRRVTYLSVLTLVVYEAKGAFHRPVNPTTEEKSKSNQCLRDPIYIGAASPLLANRLYILQLL